MQASSRRCDKRSLFLGAELASRKMHPKMSQLQKMAQPGKGKRGTRWRPGAARPWGMWPQVAPLAWHSPSEISLAQHPHYRQPGWAERCMGITMHGQPLQGHPRLQGSQHTWVLGAHKRFWLWESPHAGSWSCKTAISPVNCHVHAGGWEASLSLGNTTCGYLVLERVPGSANCLKWVSGPLAP